MEEIIYKYFPDLTEIQMKQISMLYPLYSEWNAKINVVSRKDIDQLYTHHILHSMSIAKFINFSPGESVIDIGTGGGFPGIPLAILSPATSFTLCDSIAKKIRVVTEISDALGLKNVTPICARAETISQRYDYVTSRAVTELSKFIPFVKDIYNKGIIYLKGGDIADEIAACIRDCKLSPDKISVLKISDRFDEEYFESKKILFIKR